MGIVYTTPDPGDWYSWIKKDRNKDIPLKEARRKFLQEQLDFQDQMSYHQNYVNRLNALASDGSQGAQHGIANSIKSIHFQNTPLIVGPNSGTFLAVTASFEDAVRVIGGNVLVQAASNQAGGGDLTDSERITPFTLATFDGVGQGGLELYFSSHDIPGVPTYDTNNEYLAATLLSGSADFANSDSGSATGLTDTSNANGLILLSYSASYGGGATSTGVNISASGLRNGGNTDYVNMIVATEQSSSVVYAAGDVFSLDTSGQGIGGTGFLYWTVGPEDLTGDTLSFGTGSLSLQLQTGAAIENADGEGIPSLTYNEAQATDDPNSSTGGLKTITALAASASTY
tara:strand:- start:797 stop:1825 length:1029 start_codon:yes stop_codon:yes gene_type:complete